MQCCGKVVSNGETPTSLHKYIIAFHFEWHSLVEDSQTWKCAVPKLSFFLSSLQPFCSSTINWCNYIHFNFSTNWCLPLCGALRPLFYFQFILVNKAVHSTAHCPEEVGHKNQILELVNENLLVVLLWHTEADLPAWSPSETQQDSKKTLVLECLIGLWM